VIISRGQSLDFAPQALGETTPLASATGYFYAEQGLELANKFAAYGQLYRKQPMIATLVDKLANAVARLTIQVWDNAPASGKNLVLDSPYAKLLKTPCPTMSPFNFWRWTASTYEIYGEAFWLKIRVAGQVVALFPMHPSRTAILREQDLKTKQWHLFYVFTLGVASAGLLKVPAEDVVPFLRYNPDNLMRGLSRLESLNSTLLAEDASRRANASSWKKGARPDLMISAPAALSDKAYGRLQKTIMSNHAGPDAAGGTLVLEEGAKPVPIQHTAVEMQYIESRKLNLQEGCMVYDVPPPVIHILDHATFSNITEQMRSLYRDTMPPRLEDMESTIDFFLRPEFDLSGSTDARFALDEVLRGDFEKRAVAVGQLIEKGVMKPSEGRPMFDLDDAGPVADKLYANAALQELGRPAERVTITAQAPASPGEIDDAQDAADDAAQQQDDALASRQQGTRTVVQYAPPTKRGGRPPRKEKS
jgi:HK97 family phage portal protein